MIIREKACLIAIAASQKMKERFTNVEVYLHAFEKAPHVL